MEVASLSPVPVGVLTWNSPDPCVTIVVKATFDIEADGGVSLVPDQPPLCLDMATPKESGRDLEVHGAELFYGSDFAPRKGAVDVLAVGHARATTPRRQIPFRLRVASLNLALIAVSDSPSREAPLSERAVRRVPTDASTAVRMAPANSSVRGWVSRTVAPGFDFSVFNTAPRGHRLVSLPADAQIHTEGLLRRGDRPIQLAGVSPRVFHVGNRGDTDPGGAVEMVCDTLWLDTDREHVTLVWRGHVTRSEPGQRPFIVVKLHGGGPVTWRDMSRGLSRAAWLDAAEAHQLRSHSDRPAASQSEPTLTAFDALDGLDGPESTTARLAKKLRWTPPSEPPPPITTRRGAPLLPPETLRLRTPPSVHAKSDGGVARRDGRPSRKPARSATTLSWTRLTGQTIDEDDNAVTLIEAIPLTPPSQPIPLETSDEPTSETASPSTRRRDGDD